MYSTTHAARQRGHLSRHARQRLARAEAFSRRTGNNWTQASPVSFTGGQLELVERLIRRDRTAVSSAVLAVAGIGSGEVFRAAALARVGEAAARAKAQGAISASRAAQIARHVKRAQLDQRDAGGPAVKVV